ncbi:acyl carrier protein, partial [Nonomuraea angiospora]|uniref:acyl carrier protein n=1 Tax=Nonomuraea angiospora TaxID=46172 RepID=UPI0029B3BF49
AHRAASVHTPLLADVDTLRETGRFLAPAATGPRIAPTVPTAEGPQATATAEGPKVTVTAEGPNVTATAEGSGTVPTAEGAQATSADSPGRAAGADERPAAAQPREAIAARVRDLYATTLEYPEEVFEDHAELEADLGVDSVKRVELMSRLGLLFELGPRPEDLRVSDYRTFGQVVDFVVDSLARADAA